MFKMVFKTGYSDEIKNEYTIVFFSRVLLIVILKLFYWVLQNYLRKKENLII